MDYQEMWKRLKESVDSTLSGALILDGNFMKDSECFQSVLDKMKELEEEFEKEEMRND
ncbi:hypothetical protein [Staphylococcus felis]|uniref:Phage protein n=1 Tax=Staphylococcus felis TaxID=46127 RepID=A0ABS0QM32_9STAP|nr:hypothetical protein [Staphylococcus felis]MBH9580071.1 hypothetical protein [Staphylococcus felis]